jgi:hypothetical protein
LCHFCWFGNAKSLYYFAKGFFVVHQKPTFDYVGIYRLQWMLAEEKNFGGSRSGFCKEMKCTSIAKKNARKNQSACFMAFNFMHLLKFNMVFDRYFHVKMLNLFTRHFKLELQELSHCLVYKSAVNCHYWMNSKHLKRHEKKRLLSLWIEQQVMTKHFLRLSRQVNDFLCFWSCWIV